MSLFGEFLERYGRVLKLQHGTTDSHRDPISFNS